MLKQDNDNKFIIIHIMGNHSAYQYRYPSKYNIFNNSDLVSDINRKFLTTSMKNTINHYDNAVVYNDYIIYSIIQKVKKMDSNSYVLYVSDHAEELYDTRNYQGHAENIGSRHMIEIPFILWISDKYKLNNPDKVFTLDKSVNNPYMTDDLIHTILDLSSINYELFEPQRSIINKNYNKSRNRYYANVDYDKTLKNHDSKILVSNNSHKIWIHRVNTLEKLNKLHNTFTGVELDLVFEKNENGSYFDVRHPPKKSTNLTLKHYLETQTNKKLNYWFDLKNLTNKNKTAVVKLLKLYINKYKLKNRYYLESSQHKILQKCIFR